ncbi:PREDICTED: uncharacterized protein LOC105360286 isoform X1 [Ceratosolen solmsi marchali]|uniref:Uncharacterized protein LOC105360286 isoform X1 n=1 Tax=Ceratosolen solmsi marchali TaxID=326594 RepID=A0AAJ6YCJ6_9HYME|nr:PREDICTED: uncharacterized protein LOC105360286 isoform X1 [Ceratosolen solmsi marchali]
MSAPLSKDPLLDYPETHYADLERARELENARRMEEAYRHRPAFTYSFDKPEPTREGADPPFAVPPSDPRYYQDEPFRKASTEKVPTIDQRIADLSEAAREVHSIQLKPQPKLKQMTTRTRDPIDEYAPIGGILEMNVLPEPRRRAEQDPIVISLGNRLNDDIYFIAIVAGCSAAVMFALVLISLTWCRLQRMSKAAVDVDYPAYGVTGPNKDISPSGDQRLAQSAQMYHFQHHKQQIIAMENRASATRDPGSVSEAESDEENEEGDYTVYECPGLAPTGEMEVKNPLFHDDPTPATPSKSKKEADNSDDNNV